MNARILQGGDLDHLAIHFFLKDLKIYGVAVFAYHVDHIDGDNNGNSYLAKLSCEIEISLKICTVNDVENGIGALSNEIVSCNHLFKSVGGEGIDAGKVGDDNVVSLFQLSFLLFNGYSGPVTNKLV